MSSSDEELLTAEELTALSEAFSGGARAARPSAEVRADEDQVVLRYDLIGGTSRQRHDYPALELVHEGFALHLAATLQRALRQPASFVPSRPKILNFSEIYAELAPPCTLVILDVESLGCPGLLIITPELLLLFIDLLMGGSGGPPPPMDRLLSRGFTATESHLIRHLIGYVNHSLAAAWKDIAPMQVRMLRAEVDPRHAAILSPSDRVVELRTDVVWGAVQGSLRFIVPMNGLRPYEKRLSRTAVNPPSASDPGWHDSVRSAIDEVEVTLTGLLGETSMTLRDLLALEAGDVVRLDRDPEGLLDVTVEGVRKYAGVPTVQQGNLAVRVVELLGSGAESAAAVDRDEGPPGAPVEGE